MAGHSKWHNIKIRKGKQDAQRSRMFTRYAREIIVAAKSGGDINANARLRMAVETARSGGMGKDAIERNIKKGTGEWESESYEEATFEGYGPGGVAVMAAILTDNRRRTIGDLRTLFGRNGGSPGDAGSVAWMFSNKGIVLIPAGEADQDRVLDIAVEAGAEDVVEDAGVLEVRTPPGALEAVRAALQSHGIPITSAELTMVPQTTVRLEGREAEQCLRLMEALEDYPDVQQVFANFDLPEELLEAAA